VKKVAVAALLLAGIASASEDRAFVVDADMTFASKYMSDGFKIGGDHPVWQPSIGLTTPLPGVSLAVWSAIQVDRDNQQYDEYDFMVNYGRDFFTGLVYSFNLHGYYDYWTYPKINFATPTTDAPDSSQNMHGNKLHAGVSMTNLIPLWGSHLVPTYNLYYWLYWAQNRQDLFQGGAHHEFLLSYYHDIPRLIPGVQEQYVGGSASANYNDGAFNVQPGWSHSVVALSTGVYAVGAVFALTLNRQWSFNPMVDPNNEVWSTISFTKRF